MNRDDDLWLYWLRSNRRQLLFRGGAALACLLPMFEQAIADVNDTPSNARDRVSKQDQRTEARKEFARERNGVRDQIGPEFRAPAFGSKGLNDIQLLATGTMGNAPNYHLTGPDSYFEDY